MKPVSVIIEPAGRERSGADTAAFASAISAAPKTGALAKSRAAIGLAKEKEVAVKEKRGEDTTTKIGEVRAGLP